MLCVFFLIGDVEVFVSFFCRTETLKNSFVLIKKLQMTMTTFELGVFNGKGDFPIWQQKMRGVLVQQKVVKAITGEYPATMTDEQKSESDELAYTSIILHLSDQVLRKIGKQDSAKDLWEKLEEQYMSKSLPNKLFLLERFFSFKIDMSKDLDDNLDTFNKLVQDITNAGEKVSEEYKSVILLNAIPEVYKDVKSAIKYGRDTLTPDIVINSLRSKELELKVDRIGKDFESLSVRGRPMTRQVSGQNYQENNYNNFKRNGKGRSRSKSRSENRKCYGCGKTGHFIKDCYKKKNEHRETRVDEGNVVEPLEETTVDVYVVTDPTSDLNTVNCVNDRNQDSEWILDSGCTFHMTSRRPWLENFKDLDGGEVVMGNNVACSIKGIGSVTLKFDNGYTFTLERVRYIPDLNRNLISMGNLDDIGLQGRIGNGFLKIIKGSLVLFKGTKMNGIYVTRASVVQSHIAESSSVEIDATLKWHNRLAHVNEKGLHILNKGGAFGKDVVSKVPFCECCTLGKQHRVHFKTGQHKTPEKVWSGRLSDYTTVRIFWVCCLFSPKYRQVGA